MSMELLVLGSGGPFTNATRASAGYVVSLDGAPRVLVDAGGGTSVRLGEHEVDPAELDLVLLTHTHIDHSGARAGRLRGVDGRADATARAARAGRARAASRRRALRGAPLRYGGRVELPAHLRRLRDRSARAAERSGARRRPAARARGRSDGSLGRGRARDDAVGRLPDRARRSLARPQRRPGDARAGPRRARPRLRRARALRRRRGWGGSC